MLNSQDDHLLYFQRELTYLRKMGQAFAEKYPKIAGRLELGTEHSQDPNIERLIEAFAFLTARIQISIENEFPEVSSALLNVLYPHFMNPVPSMSIAQFEPDPEQGLLTSGHLIKKQTPLFSTTGQGEICRFRTCYPVTLWPLKVKEAVFESTDKYEFLDQASDIATVLRLRITSNGAPLNKLKLDNLVFYLNDESATCHEIYELLFCNVRQVGILAEDTKNPVFLPEESITPVGFEPDEDILPYNPLAHPGYRMLQEYFSFPENFMFFRVNHLNRITSKKTIDLLILLDRKPRDRMVISPKTFCLGCTPIINLFTKTSEPIRLEGRETEYRIQPDHRRERITEIHSLLKVSGSSDPKDETRNYAPFYSFNHEMTSKGQDAFWYAARQLTGRKDLPGTEMILRFVDLKFNPRQPPSEIVFAHTLCTNRDLAEQLPDNAKLQIEEAAPLQFIRCLRKPTPQLTPSIRGETLWKLISHLSLNHLSFSDGGAGSLTALKEILRLYSFSNRQSSEQQIQGLRDMQCRKVIRRAGSEAWRGFCRGTEITLTFDEKAYVGNSAFLMASTLNRFFALYASVNSFTQLIIKSAQRDGTWKRWQPMVGEKIVL